MSETPHAPSPEPTERNASGLSRALRRGRGALLPIVIIAGIAVVWFAIGASGGDRAGGAQVEPQTIGVTAHEVVAQSIPFGPWYLGRTEATQRVEIRSRVRGFLQERRFREGTIVTADQPLFQIDPKPFQAEVSIGRARVAAAEARLERSQRQLARYRDLFATSAATSTEVEEWETEYLVAMSDLELSRAELTKNEIDLSYTAIASPINGVIGLSLRDVGSFVDDGANSLLATVEQIDPIYVSFTMSERELLRWRTLRGAGTLTGPDRESIAVEVMQSDRQLHRSRGRLNFVDMTIDQTTSTVMLRAIVPNSDRTLRPGQPVNVRMLGFERVGVLMVPKGAVLQTPTSASVYVIDLATGMVEARPVTLGDWHEWGWIIESGLSEGEMVATDQLLRLRAGMTVTVLDVSDTLEPEPGPELDNGMAIGVENERNDARPDEEPSRSERDAPEGQQPERGTPAGVPESDALPDEPPHPLFDLDLQDHFHAGPESLG